MEKEFVPHEIALKLKELRFDAPCLGFYFGKDREVYLSNDEHVMAPFNPDLDSKVMFRAPTFSQAFRWFREKYDLHIQIRKEDYFYKNTHYKYFHFDISKGQQQDITGQQDLYDNIMDECSQDILENYLNNEKLNILIFERGFAFKTYEEIELACLTKLIEIVVTKEIKET